MGGTSDEKGNAVTVDASGNVYTTGYFKGIADFDPSAASYTLSSNGVMADVFISKLDASGNFLWAKSLGSPLADDEGAGIATDAAGNVYVTGNFYGTVDFDPGPGTYTLTAGGTDIFVMKLDAGGNLAWARNLGGSNSEYGYGIALDASGNVYTTGFFNGVVDFDPGPATYTLAPNGSLDVFVSKLDAGGNFMWARNLGGSNSDVGYSIATDASGNVYTSGEFKGTADFNPSAATYTIASGGGDAAFVSKLDANGNFVWAKALTGSSTTTSSSWAVRADAGGNVYASGYYIGTTDFDPDVATYTLSSGVRNGFVLKLDASGNFAWAREIVGSVSSSAILGLALDGSGNVYGGGSFDGPADFDPGASTYSLTPTLNSEDVFVFKWDASGSFVWAQNLVHSAASGSTCRLYGLAMSPASGNVYATGFFNYTADFDFGSGTSNMTSAGSWDVFVNKIGQSGFCTAPPAPANATPPASQAICAGATATLSATSTGTVTWYATATGTTALGTGTAYVASSLAAGQYTYYAEASTCTVSASRTAITLTVNATPVISVNSGSICSGSSFTIVPSGAATYTYSGGSAVVSPTSTTSYSVTGTSAAGCVSPNAAVSNVTVNATPVISVNSGSICSGNSFMIVPSGANTYTISGGSAVVSPTSTTSYSVTGTSTAGCVSSNAAVSNVTVNATPVISVNSGSICSGSSFTIVPSGANTYTISGGSAIVSPTTTTGYSVSGTSAAGCVGSNAAISTVTVHALPLVAAVSNATLLCAGQPAILTASGAATYTWSSGATGSTLSVSPATTTTYSVTGSSAAGCIGTATVVQNVSPCTSVGEEEELMVQVYPNPGHGLVTLSVPMVFTVLEATVYDLSGRLMYQGRLRAESQPLQLDLGELPKGLYFLVLHRDGRQQVHKLVIE